MKDVAFQSVPSVLGMIISPDVSSFTTDAIALMQNVFGLCQDPREVQIHPSYFLMKIDDNRRQNASGQALADGMPDLFQ
jgi:hypothetical protein